MPGSWPDGDRDVAIFNFWGNETNITNRKTPNTGSGVAFFNQTYKAKKIESLFFLTTEYSTVRYKLFQKLFILGQQGDPNPMLKAGQLQAFDFAMYLEINLNFLIVDMIEIEEAIMQHFAGVSGQTPESEMLGNF